ncbi:MAG: adenylate/guanylate cyclase domain-containing protein [Gammaproteobacteria bacterium]
MKLVQKRYWQPLVMGLAIIAIVLYVHTSANPSVSATLERLEGIFYDVRMRFFLPNEPELDPRVIIIDIDDKSLNEIGRWPWPRVNLAKLINKLNSASPAAIGLDIMFVEPEISPLDLLMSGAEDDSLKELIPEAVEQINTKMDGDVQFSKAISEGNVILGFSLAPNKESSTGKLSEPVIRLSESEQKELLIAEMPGYLASIEEFQQVAAGSGFVFVKPDDDGVIRWGNMILRYQDGVYPSLSLALMHHYLGMPPIELIKEHGVDGKEVLEGISLGGMITIPTDPYGRVLVPFRGGPKSFTYLSATDIIHDRFDPAQLADALILIGSTAQGLYDLRATPVGSIFPGVEVHANLLMGMLDEHFPQTAEWSEGFNYLMILIVGSLLALIMPKLQPGKLVLITAASITAYIGLSFWFWDNDRIVLSQVLPLTMLFWLGAINAAFGFLRETSERRYLKNIFGQYVPPEIVEEMNQAPDASYGFEGESREMTVLFADIRSFTTISESLEADELKQLLNYFFTPMTEIIFNNRGAIDKYVGDMIMAFWGAPLDDKLHARHAILAALEMLEKLETMQEEIREKGWPEIKIGIGLNTGRMNVGDMGSTFRRSYTVLGDAVNLGSRLEGLTKYYGVTLCVSEYTMEGAQDLSYRLLDKVRVKGKRQAIKIYQPIKMTSHLNDQEKDELSQHEKAMQLYFAGAWDDALKVFGALNTQHPERYLYQIYLERIPVLKQQNITLPWDGVFEHTQK